MSIQGVLLVKLPDANLAHEGGLFPAFVFHVAGKVAFVFVTFVALPAEEPVVRIHQVHEVTYKKLQFIKVNSRGIPSATEN